MPTRPEQLARQQIDAQLTAAGWVVQDPRSVDLRAGRGIAIREASLAHGYGTADYLLYSDRKALGVVEAKAEGVSLTSAEVQTERYGAGLPQTLPAWRRPLPFLYQSTGVETQFTNGLDPEPRSRGVYAFHRPETLLGWVLGLTGVAVPPAGGSASLVRESADYATASSVLRRLQAMPALDAAGMRPVQARAIRALEQSLAGNRPRALVQMATGSGKTFTAVALACRLLKYSGFRRILFLVDRRTLGQQALREFQQYTTPDDGRKFAELYNVQHLQSNAIDPVSRVCIATIQRVYAMLAGKALSTEDEESSVGSAAAALRAPVPVSYNPAIPIETFDLVITDECHRSIYNLWRQVLEYFDAYLVGLTATPSKQTLGFFSRNLVMEYGHPQAVADGVNVDFNVYRIATRITAEGARVDAGMRVDRRDRRTRRVRWEQLEDDLSYTSGDLDRSVVAVDQIRTIVRTFRDRLPTEIFPGRTEVPKTLVFAKDDSHADDIVRIFREEFGRGNEFCEKITYRTSTARIVSLVKGADGSEHETVTYQSTGVKPEDLLASFRNSYNPRIAVTVDMIATGTDVRPLEIVFFMRDVKSATYFDQMKGRGTRVISPDDMRSVTPDARTKDRFVIVDAVGVCEGQKVDSPSLDRKPSAKLQSLLDSVGMGSTDEDVVSTLAGRLARLEPRFTPAQQTSIERAAGRSLREIIQDLAQAVNPDAIVTRAQEISGDEPTAEQIEQAAAALREEAIQPLLPPGVRELIAQYASDNEQTIDTVTQDDLRNAGFDGSALEKARATTRSFAEYLEKHRDEITALQILYSRPKGRSLTLEQIKDLAAALHRPPHRWTPEGLWQAYETLHRDRVHGSGQRLVTDLVSLVRFTLKQESVLVPFGETVNERFERWMSRQQDHGVEFTPAQRTWLEMVRDHVASSLSVSKETFDEVPFSDSGGQWEAANLFGDRLQPILDDLNQELAA